MSKSTFRILFYLRKNYLNKSGKAGIMIRLTVNGDMVQFSSKLDIEPSLWDTKAGKAAGNSVKARQMNSMLEDIRTALSNHYRYVESRDSFVTAEKGLTTDRTPFRHVYTGVAKTMKRAVPAEVIRKIKGLDLTLQPALAQARDYFLLSFYLRGISFVDLSQLKTTDIQNGNTRCRKSSATTTGKARPICCRCSTESVATRAGITRTPCNG